MANQGAANFCDTSKSTHFLSLSTIDHVVEAESDIDTTLDLSPG
jgi:hypothetical protein